MEGTDTTVLDSKAKGLIRWYLYSTDFPLLRQKYEREGKAELMKCLYRKRDISASSRNQPDRRMDYDHPFSYQLYREDQPGVPADPDGKDRKPWTNWPPCCG
ncbi:hypothetical protein NXV14_14725 [Bacteroides fragilis]|nr:hypothetical protein [Bacteroides fragilis]